MTEQSRKRRATSDAIENLCNTCEEKQAREAEIAKLKDNVRRWKVAAKYMTTEMTTFNKAVQSGRLGVPSERIMQLQAGEEDRAHEVEVARIKDDVREWAIVAHQAAAKMKDLTKAMQSDQHDLLKESITLLKAENEDMRDKKDHYKREARRWRRREKQQTRKNRKLAQQAIHADDDRQATRSMLGGFVNELTRKNQQAIYADEAIQVMHARIEGFQKVIEEQSHEKICYKSIFEDIVGRLPSFNTSQLAVLSAGVRRARMQGLEDMPFRDQIEKILEDIHAAT